jgi:hypothetical protein
MKTLGVVSLIAMVGACSSNYMPRSRGRIAVTMENGAPSYVRDGQPHPHGWFGSGLTEAVAGNRLAEQAASEYHDRLVDGVLLTTVGAVCMPVALGYALAQSESESGLSRNSGEVAGAVALGCTVMMIVGAGYAASAEPYRWDAINLFNDGAEPNLGPPTAQLLPRSAPAKSSLEMR